MRNGEQSLPSSRRDLDAIIVFLNIMSMTLRSDWSSCHHLLNFADRTTPACDSEWNGIPFHFLSKESKESKQECRQSTAGVQRASTFTAL